MPPAFENVLAPAAELWAPLQYDTSLPRRAGRGDITCARSGGCGRGRHRRRRPQETRCARSRACWRRDIPATVRSPTPRFAVASLHDELTRGVRPALLAVFGAVTAGAGHRVRERDEPAPRPRRAAARRVRAARGARRRPPRLIRAAAHREPLLAGLWRRRSAWRSAMLGVRALVALSPPGLPRVGAIQVERADVRFRPGPHDAHRAGLRPDPGAAGGAQRSAAGAAARLAAHRRRSPRYPQRARRRRGRARARAAGQLGAAAAEPPAPVRRRPGFDSAGLLTMQVQTAGHRFDRTATRSGSSQCARRGAARARRDRRRAHQPAAAERRRRRVRRALRGDADPTGRDVHGVSLCGEPGLLRDDEHSAPPRPPARRARRRRRAAGRADQRVAGAARVPAQDPIGQRLQIGPGRAVHHRRRGRRREADVARAERVGRGLHPGHAVALVRRSRDVARRPDAAATRPASRPPCARRSGRSTRTSRSCASRRWIACSPRRRRSGASR